MELPHPVKLPILSPAYSLLIPDLSLNRQLVTQELARFGSAQPAHSLRFVLGQEPIQRRAHLMQELLLPGQQFAIMLFIVRQPQR